MVFKIESGKLIEGDGITSEPIPAEVTEICANSFSKSQKTLQKLSFSGPLLQTIKDSAFVNCIYLEEVDFSNCNKLTTIEQFVFWGCNKLSNLKLTSSIRTIGFNVFRD